MDKTMMPSSNSWMRALWIFALVVCLAILIASLPQYFLRWSAEMPATEFSNLAQLGTRLGVVLSLTATLLSLALAGLLYWKKSDERMALFVSFFLLGYGIALSGPLELFFEYWFPLLRFLPLAIQGLLFSGPTFILVLIFPNGKFAPRWTRDLVPIVLILTAIVYLGLDAEEAAKMNTLRSQIANGVLYAFFFFAMGNQAYRYRHHFTHAERQQTKWVVYGAALWIFLLVLSSFQYYAQLNQPPGTPTPWWSPFVGASWWLTLNIIPISFTLAIMRSRLWDIDAVIRRTLTYGALTATLALFYFGVVILLQQLFHAITGREQSEIVTVVSTLAIAALFTPLRARVQNAIDHRFYRRKYDAAQTLAAFSATARDEVELSKLSEQLVSVVEETMQPSRIFLWLRHPSRDLGPARKEIAP